MEDPDDGSYMSVLVFVVIMTAAVLINRFTGFNHYILFSSYDLNKWYGFYGLCILRVWSALAFIRWWAAGYGADLAALWLPTWGFCKSKSRFRITVNGGNASVVAIVYVLWDGYWCQSLCSEGQDIVRSSCVGCGICAAVCPQGRIKTGKWIIDIENRALESITVHIKGDGCEVIMTYRLW